jgi:nicotinamide mononucleotide (NMN) deamidase PncC
VEGLEPLTEAMVMRFAEVARKQLDATWAVAELGVAGPTGARYGHPPGISVIAVDGPVRLSFTLETRNDDREENMWAFTAQAFELLAQAISAATRPAD